jgi:hypothetical protein
VAELYFDHNVARSTATHLRSRGHQVVTAIDIGLEAAKDDEHFLTAAQHSWIMVTYDREDFILLHDAWRRWLPTFNVEAVHAGILIIPQPPRWTVERAADELDAFVMRQLSFANTLHLWQSSKGWVRRP